MSETEPTDSNNNTEVIDARSDEAISFDQMSAAENRPSIGGRQSMSYQDMRHLLRAAHVARSSAANYVGDPWAANNDLEAQAEEPAEAADAEERPQLNERWSACLSQPSQQWPQRKCNIFINWFCTFSLIFSEAKGCGIPLNSWLATYFALFILETFMLEMRDRINESLYWSDPSRRWKKKFVSIGSYALKESFELYWCIYGASMYWSEQSDDCMEQNQLLMYCMLFFILMGLLKIVLVGCVIAIVIYMLVQRKLQRRQAQMSSRQVLRSIQKIPFGALATGGDTDEECSICFCEYEEKDTVTQLECNPKHVFHTECLSGWIRQGKNSCPICRASINSEVEL